MLQSHFSNPVIACPLEDLVHLHTGLKFLVYCIKFGNPASELGVDGHLVLDGVLVHLALGRS